MPKPHLHRRLPAPFVEDVLEAFNAGRMSETQACVLLEIKRARLYRLRRDWLKNGKRLRVEPKHPARNWPPEVEAWFHAECQYIREHAGPFQGRFNFAVLAEAAERHFHRRFDRAVVRRWAQRQGYYQGTPQETAKVYLRFETAGPGALFQHDTSRHCWVPRLGGYQDLILTQDDYSRRIVAWHLTAQETLWDHLVLVQATLERIGLPQAYYVDQHSFFRYVAHSSFWKRYRPKTDQGEVQFRRALQALDVGVIYAQSPQAKGKIEKRFDYFQRRLPQLCERYGITEVVHAEPLLVDLIGYYNDQRPHAETAEIPGGPWDRALRQGQSRLRPVPDGVDLSLTFALQEPRLVKSDRTISFGGQRYPVGAPPGQVVTVCFRPNERIVVLHDGLRAGEYAV